MKSVLFSFVLMFPVLGFAYYDEPYVEDCLKGLHFNLTANNMTYHNISSVKPDFMCANLTIPKTNLTFSSVVTQYHVWDSNLTSSLYRSINPQYTTVGDHVGLVWLMDQYQTPVQGYVARTLGNYSTREALILYTPISTTQPVPGACNLEADLEVNPNLHISYEVQNVLINVTFSEANVGYPPLQAPACQDSAPAHDRLRYDFYIRYIPWNKYSQSSLFEELKKMMTVDAIKKNGQMIHTFGKNDRPELRLAMFNGRGIIANIIVRDTLKPYGKSAYVPAVTYACGQNNGSMCHGRIEPLYAILYVLGMLVGGAICFLGHRYFLAEIFFFGFLPCCLLSYMMFAANVTTLSQPVIMVLALVFGIPGGCIWMALWWRFGYVLPIMMWISFTLGYLLSSIIFFTPFGNLSVWYNSLAYGMAFMCGVMIVPVILIVFTKFLSMLACSVWGAYLIVAALSYFSGGVLHYIMLNIIHRASIPGYSEAIIVVPMNPVDYFLISLWFVLIVAGVLVQRRLTRGRRDFPICAYKERKLLRHQRNAMRNEIQYGPAAMPPPQPQPLNDPIGEQRDDAFDDQEPLVINH